MLQVSGHIKHVVVLVALHSCHHFTCCQLFPHVNFSPVCEFLADFVDSHTAKTGLLRCCLYKKSQGTSSGTTLRLRAPQTWTVLCGSVDQYLWTTGTRAISPRQWKLVPWCQRVFAVAKLDTRNRGVDSAMRSVAIVARLDISERCADNVRNLQSLEQQWQEFWQTQCEPCKHRQVLLLWTGRSSTTWLPPSKRELQPLWQAWSFEPSVSIFWRKRKCSGCWGGTRWAWGGKRNSTRVGTVSQWYFWTSVGRFVCLRQLR